MKNYIIHRMLMMIPLMLLISFIAFLLLNLVPSNPAEVALRVGNVVPTDEAIALMQQELGLDKPFLIRYFHWLWQILHLDFGRSFIFRTPVLTEILNALPATLYLAAATFILSLVISFSIAFLCVLTRNTWVDKVIRCITFTLMALPNYWLGLLLIWLFAVCFNLLPVSGMLSFKSVLLPAITLSFVYIGTYLRLMRGAMLNQLQQPYVFYARARGLPESRIILKHVLPNALHTTLVSIGLSIPSLIAGTVVIENIFAWPGIGRLCVAAILGRDYPMIQAYILLIALLFLVFNFLIDLLQLKLNPSLRRH